MYALNAETGALIWRFLAAPHQRLIMAYGQAESAWPVFGSLIPVNGLIWATAGRQAELDHGMYWYGLDPVTGEPVKQGRFAQASDWHAYAREGRLEDEHPLSGTPKSWANGPRPQHEVNGPMMFDGERLYWWRKAIDIETKEPVILGNTFKAGWKNNVNVVGTSYHKGLEPSTQFGLLRHGVGGSYGGINGSMFSFNGDEVYYFGGGQIHRVSINSWVKQKSGAGYTDIGLNNSLTVHWTDKIINNNFSLAIFSAHVARFNHG